MSLTFVKYLKVTGKVNEIDLRKPRFRQLLPPDRLLVGSLTEYHTKKGLSVSFHDYLFNV